MFIDTPLAGRQEFLRAGGGFYKLRHKFLTALRDKAICNL